MTSHDIWFPSESFVPSMRPRGGAVAAGRLGLGSLTWPYEQQLRDEWDVRNAISFILQIGSQGEDRPNNLPPHPTGIFGKTRNQHQRARRAPPTFGGSHGLADVVMGPRACGLGLPGRTKRQASVQYGLLAWACLVLRTQLMHKTLPSFSCKGKTTIVGCWLWRSFLCACPCGRKSGSQSFEDFPESRVGSNTR